MAERRILRLERGEITVARESKFESEERLHAAVSAHPEVLPFEELGLGVPVTLANELDLGGGPLDTLAADPSGQLIIIEYKKGSENSDVRKVVAQVLDYGSAMWRKSYSELEAACLRSGMPGTLVARMQTQLEKVGHEAFDADSFEAGLAKCLDDGTFVFLYVARDLDAKTNRIMTYLAEGPKMRFFAIEVDYFHDGDGETSVLVPRVAFTPSWIANPSPLAPSPVIAPRAQRIAAATPMVKAMWEKMDALVDQLQLVADDTKTGRAYRPVAGAAGIGVYASDREVEFDMASLRAAGLDEVADQLTHAMSRISGQEVTAASWPAVSCAPLVRDFDRTRRELIEPYFAARRTAHITLEQTTTPPPPA